MIEGMPWQAWTTVMGVSASLNALFVVLIYRGKLVPRIALEDKEHEANEWRTEARLNQQTISEVSQQNTALLREFGPLLTDFLQDLREAADIPERERDGAS